jgi:hypothetical protein
MCKVVFIYEGEDYNLQILEPDKKCLLEQYGLIEEVKSIRAWSDGRDGYIEYNADSR